MIYISDKEVKELALDWPGNVGVIEASVRCLAGAEYAQPVKPYLRYGDLKNRIIAMPAFVGGNINMSGIKWIASFPDNIGKGLPRAHCVMILNNADTGEPVAILNSGSISAIRTASVSGFVLGKYLEKRRPERVTLGIVGFGPIGQYHLRMCASLLGDRCSRVVLYDLNPINPETIDQGIRDKVEVAGCWQQVYDDADVFITCTVSRERYIDRKPKPGSLHLNVSLRDYQSGTYPWFKGAIIVDDWEEICRENTDVERFHLEEGLQQSQVQTIRDLVDADGIQLFDDAQAVMFNPMGMAVFDIAIARHYMLRMQTESRPLVLS
jgi:ornithine cyclodeaminase